jgi:rod shape-determining protein MreD
MTGSRVSLFVALIVTAILAQVTIVNRIPLPAARPDLALLVVVSCALVEGPLRGAIVGFAAGLTADLVPPADHTIGRLALAFAVVGYVAGMLEDGEERSVAGTIVIVGLATAGAVLTYAGVGAIVGDERVTWDSLARGLPVAVLYDVILAPFIVPFVARAVRWVDVDVVVRR